MTVEISPHRSLYGSINESEYSLEQSVGHLDPLALLGFLLDAENSHNNNLIEILGLIKPTKSAPCTSNLNLIIRGLFTKNSKILKILNNNYQDLLHESNPKDCFKNFINDFIIYLENGGLIIFQKYFDLFPVEYDYLIFAKPILHTQNYIDFIHNSTCLLRNPFVIEKLNNFADEMLDLVDNYNEHYESFKLNNITFNNTKLFGESLSTLHSSSPSSSSNLNRVSSFFKINQISERTKNENLYLANNSNQKIELVLLDLSNSNSYNALAILAIPDPSNIDQARSLIHPPLRVNEVSISFHSNTITLHALSFSKKQRSNDEICISGDQNILLSWYNKLSKIFPNSSSPISKKPTKEFQLSGLGINTYDYPSSPSSNSISSINSSKSFQQPPFLTRKQSTTSINSMDSNDSLKSRYDRSLDIIHKTLSNNSHAHDTPISSLAKIVSMEDDDANDCESLDDDESILAKPIAPAGNFYEVKNNSSLLNLSNDYQRKQQNIYSSVPDLSETKPPGKPSNAQSSLYQLSSGSAIDINNFGKNHNPSFTDCESFAPPRSLSSKASSSSINQKNVTINTTSLEEAERLRLSTISEKSDTPTPKMATSTSLPSPFALPSSTSTYFFKPYKNSCSTPATPKDVAEEHLYIPQSLKDVINSDSSIDFYITPTSPKAMKVSKWKQKYGKWEMLTVNENIFLKIVANYDLNKSWLIFFKEEYDDTYDEVIDKPIMLMNINEESSIRHSSALDLQVNSTDSISNQSLLIMIRCTNGSFASSIHSNYKNILGVIKNIPKNKSVAHSLGFNDSNVTSSSSLMEKPSNSSTFTSLNSSNIGNDSTIKQPALKTDPILGKEISFASLNSDDITNANIISNPDNSKMLLLNQMTVRLQKQLDSYSAINIPSSWEILSMFSLSIFLINDSFTHKAYYNLILENNNIDNDDPAIETFNWLIGEDEKFNRIERIGKAGLLIKAGNDEIFMIECKGKKEFKHLFEIF
ncbi:hypothetical protein HYPBUDRAFT_142817 [Hyphopichia burtonii NRRL Y-1933]|uniref:PH-like domain-containing protein n=1 Tax=Hyphopichia burtonii NRRL Y-1933 TaxID=984485 RepID=A0A1E4RDS9_9ASCO|nr:hypothetical protein HYPBUDRAFT_142817 [Hyphopichia burtonii NRRL Y-1933]ODV65386.1 hypothetical protein HYPBUDRAFT_142817 [Hyphopichia burtonii NRRL Y-1933]